MAFLTSFLAQLMLYINPMIVHPVPETPVLEYKIRLPKDGTQKPPVLFLLHGYGSNESDLFSFSDRIPDNWLIISARGPITLGEGSYCWYHLEVAADGKMKINFQEEESSRQLILQLLAQVIELYHADPNKVVFAGFSQGAIMSMCMGLTHPEKVAGFACFSGRFMEEIKPFISKSSALKKLKVFIAHGTEDKMLPISMAVQSKEVLQNLGIPFTYSEDKTPHTISNKQFEDFLRWFNF